MNFSAVYEKAWEIASEGAEDISDDDIKDAFVEIYKDRRHFTDAELDLLVEIFDDNMII